MPKKHLTSKVLDQHEHLHLEFEQDLWNNNNNNNNNNKKTKKTNKKKRLSIFPETRALGMHERWHERTKKQTNK